MIGVIAKSSERAVVEEFFQLFKTPWEFIREGYSYDVVIVTADEMPEQVDARLLVHYRAEATPGDATANLVARTKRRGISLDYQGIRVPVYGQALLFNSSAADALCVTVESEIAGVKVQACGRTVLRVGYDLFQEVAFLLSTGQPVEQARIPTIEVHIAMLREWILAAGISVMEITPAPAGRSFIVSLTHDIDFIGIRRHRFDHTMWGFLYRSTFGAARDFVRGRISFGRLIRIWWAAASLPFVYLGWAKDFWNPFEWYLRVEKNLPATYFLIPFKRRAGDRVSARHAERRATAYDVADLPDWTAALRSVGCEIGVHGIDAWHSVDKGREELKRFTQTTGQTRLGIRMHWLLRDENTFRVLEESGYDYDSTAGYNETVGYRSGTCQVFRPLGVQRLLELPLHIQDGALFYPLRLDLSEKEAADLCNVMIANARRFGGVLTVLWHDRSPGPERYWGDFYADLVARLKSSGAWFGTAAQVVDWFRTRREVTFERVESLDGTVRARPRYAGGRITPPLNVRVHRPAVVAGKPAATYVDFSWAGETKLEPGRLAAGNAEPACDSKPLVSQRA